MKSSSSIWSLAVLLFSTFACTAPGSDELRLSSWVSSPSETALFKQTLEDFRSSHPEMAFKYEPIPGNYSEKLQLMLGTNTAPDLFFLKGMTAPSYMSFGILEPLDDLIAETEDFDKRISSHFPWKPFNVTASNMVSQKILIHISCFTIKKCFGKQALIPSLRIGKNWNKLPGN